MPGTGNLLYAASIFRKTDTNYILTYQDIIEHEHTTDRRWELRPAHVYVQDNLNDQVNIIKEIRWQMCHGPGCKGPRPKDTTTSIDNDSVSQASSDDSFLSSVSNGEVPNYGSMVFYLNRWDFEKECGRYYFVAYKRDGQHILYGASIFNLGRIYGLIPNQKAHYMTAQSRLDKCPVKITISDDEKHTTDISDIILNNIRKRKNGRFQIKGERV